MAKLKKVRIERLEQLEERFGVELRGVTAQETLKDDDHNVYVYGEVFSNTSEHDRDLEVLASVYSSKGKVIGQGLANVFIHKMVGFDPFAICATCSLGHGRAAHVRVYVKPSAR